MATLSPFSSIGFWEFLEYLFESAVIIGCAGEALGEFTNFLNVKNDSSRKDRLLKISTIILLCGLAGALASTVRTNALAANAIDELDEKAKQALGDSDKAVENSGKAIKAAYSAADTSGKAFGESKKAVDSASSALNLATGARREADSFERQIAKAERDASAAEAHLAEAMQRAREATAELQRIKSPRSLINLDSLIPKLAAFEGTEYRLSVFGDDESIQFTKMINDVLHRAGWVRKPSPYRLGIPSIQVFGSERESAIPICFATGVQIHFRSNESLGVLNARPLNIQTPTLQAAFSLREALSIGINPQNERNVEDKIILDENPDDKFPLVICVGKKP